MKVLSFIISVIILALATTGVYRYLKQDWLLYRTAQDLSRKEAWAQTIPIYENLVKRGFRTRDTLRLLAQSYEKEGNLAMAIAAIRELAVLNPGDGPTALQLAGLYDRTGDHRDAADIYYALLAREPANRAIEIRLARALAASGRFDDAILRYKAILGEKP
jgi:tetratricopeptide (TPR) repeat protein